MFFNIVVLADKVKNITGFITLKTFVRLTGLCYTEAVVAVAKRTFLQMVFSHLEAGFSRDNGLQIKG